MIVTRTIGIDLGTTNSAVAMLELNEQDLLLCRDSQSRSTIPSCVWQNPRTGEIVVGHRAYARKGSIPEPVTSIKRSMGTQITVTLGKKQYTPPQISAFILQDLKHQINAELQSRSSDGVTYEVNRAIITVPAYFSLPAIEATREAGQIAGLEVAELLHEPTAAAIYYSWKYDLGDGVYMVYDLGGGTFDVSVLRRTAGEFLVLGVSGDNFLGGDDFDRRLAEHLRTLLVAEGYEMDLNPNNDPEDLLRFNQLMALAERAKKELSTKDEIILRDQGTLRDKEGSAVVVEAALTRADFEGLIEDLLERTIACCQKALEKARIKSDTTIENVDHILLVGGSTYVPAVMEKVKKAFSAEQNKNPGAASARSAPVRDEPENAVALGAALRAAAAGLGILDDNRRVRVWFRGSGATKREQTTISGQIEPLEDNLPLENGLIRLTGGQGELLGEVTLKPGLQFAFPGLELQAESLNQFRIEILDASGQQVALVERSVMQAAAQKEAVGSALSTSVLSKPIILEGTDGDRLVRQELLPEGTSLPATARFTFAVNDPGGHIRLPIFQQNRIIKELQAEVGKVAAGTPVKIEIHCDEQVNIQVNFSIEDQNFGGKIAPPPPDAVPTEYEVQQIDQRFRAALQSLDQEDMLRLVSAYEQTRRDLNEARAGGDYPKVIQRAKDLEALVRDARMAEPLRPPLEELVEKYQACVKLLPKATAKKPELTNSSLKDDLEKALKKGQQAYKQRDREEYAEAAQLLGTSLQFLINLTKVRIQEGEGVDAVMQALMGLDECRQFIQFLLINCLFMKQTDFIEDLREYMEELDNLEIEVNKNPVPVFNRCRVIMVECQRIYKQLIPENKRAQELSGLLKLDAKKRAPDIGAADDLF